MRAAARRWFAPPLDAVAGESRTGLYRATNEDRILIRSRLAAVADGMGGHAHGEAAAEAVISCLATVEIIAPADVRHALEECDLALHAGTGPISGATVAVLLWTEGGFHCLWAGDCRVYRLRDGELVQLTRDHRLVQTYVDAGLLTSDDARGHPQGAVVTSAIGAGDCDIESVSGEIRTGDRFLLCSDGLSDTLVDGETARLLAEGSATEAVASLQEAALHEARDNVSVIVVDIR